MKTKHPTTILKQWMREATTSEQIRLAEAGGTTRGQLYQVAGGFRKFRPGKAIALERKAKEMHAETGGRLPLIYRTDMASECAGCEFARKCLGAAAVRADFEAVEDDTQA
jgi:hypothetical protein